MTETAVKQAYKGALLMALPMRDGDSASPVGKSIIGYGEILNDHGETLSIKFRANREVWDRRHVMKLDTVEEAKKIYLEYVNNPENF